MENIIYFILYIYFSGSYFQRKLYMVVGDLMLNNLLLTFRIEINVPETENKQVLYVLFESVVNLVFDFLSNSSLNT